MAQAGRQSRPLLAAEYVVGRLPDAVLGLVVLGEGLPLLAQERLPVCVAQRGGQERSLLLACGVSEAAESTLRPELSSQASQVQEAKNKG